MRYARRLEGSVPPSRLLADRAVGYQTHTLQADTAEMASILATQIDEANTVFGKFIRRNYRDLLLNEPLTSPGLIRSRVMPLLKEVRCGLW